MGRLGVRGVRRAQQEAQDVVLHVLRAKTDRGQVRALHHLRRRPRDEGLMIEREAPVTSDERDRRALRSE